MAPAPKDENKRRRIIAAAIRVFAEVGVSNGKIATIAAKAGIGKGTVYEYFSSKEEIFAAVFQEFTNRLLGGYTELAATSMDPVQKIGMMFDYTYDYLDEQLSGENGSEWLIFLEIFLQGYRDQMLGNGRLSFNKVMRDMYEAFKPFIEEGINAGIFRKLDAEHVTFILFAALDGIAIHYFINRDHYDKTKLKSITKEIFLNGLLKPKSGGA